MKSLKLHLLLIGCMLVGSCSLAWATELQFGQTVTGTISAAAQTNRYTFTASAGDVIYLTMTATSDSLSPLISVYTSTSATPFASAFGNNGYGNCGGTVATLNTVTLPPSQDGTYTVIVGDCLSTNTGAYAVYAQRTSKPSAVLSSPIGQTTSGTIALAAQSNTYTFSAKANEDVDLVVTASTPSLSPLIQLYSPTGAFVDSAFGNNGYGNCGGNTAELYETALPSGTYTVLLGDCLNRYTGNYGFFLQSINSPVGGISLLWDQIQSGTIGLAAWNDTYTFRGTANDRVDFTVTKTGDSLSPAILLYYASTGKQVSYAFANNGYGNCGGSTLTDTVVLPTTGDYTLLVRDCLNRYTGKYNLSTQCFGACLQPSPGPITISPQSAEEGSANVTLTVMGSNFLPDSVVEWNGAQLKTTYVGNTKVMAIIPAADLKVPGPYSVRVFTPPPGGGLSPSVPFTVLGPVIISLVPSSAIRGAPAFTLTVNGAGFVSVSVVRWNNEPRQTKYVSPTEVQALIPASDIAVAGFFPITIANGTIVSPPVQFTVDNPPPGVTSLSPPSIIVGGNAFTLIVKGSGFVPGSLVEWKGTALTTTFVNSMELEGAVPGSDIVSGIVPVTVHSTSPGGGTSLGSNLTINNPVPVLSSLSQTSVAHGTASLTLTVKGFDFNEGVRVLWKGAALTTTFVSDSQLTAAVPAADMATAGKATITVTNPAPTPSASNAITFTIN
jgi:hypothetical protein